LHSKVNGGFCGKNDDRNIRIERTEAYDQIKRVSIRKVVIQQDDIRAAGSP
jgi:hypothetical protein